MTRWIVVGLVVVVLGSVTYAQDTPAQWSEAQRLRAQVKALSDQNLQLHMDLATAIAVNKVILARLNTLLGSERQALETELLTTVKAEPGSTIALDTLIVTPPPKKDEPKSETPKGETETGSETGNEGATKEPGR